MGTRALMRVVLDTNVLLSALLSPHGAVDAIYRAWQKDRFDLVTSTTQIDELRRASRYAKFKDVLPPHGACDPISRAGQRNLFDLVTSTTKIDELRRPSRYAKFKDVLQPHRVGTMVSNMRRSIMLDALPPLADGIEANDPNDRFLLAMTLAGDADDLVTGDHRAGLLQRGSLGRTRIITPVTFCAEAL